MSEMTETYPAQGIAVVGMSGRFPGAASTLELWRNLRDGVESGELAPHDTETVAAALVGATGESLVGPLARHARRADRREALVAGLVQFCTSAIPIMDRSVPV